MAKMFDEIYAKLLEERKRQVAKWGIQSWPSVDEMLSGRGMERLCEEYEIPTERRAKQLMETSNDRLCVTWAHIALEEFCEAICAEDEDSREEELLQLSTVLFSWIQDIRYKRELNKIEYERREL